MKEFIKKFIKAVEKIKKISLNSIKNRIALEVILALFVAIIGGYVGGVFVENHISNIQEKRLMKSESTRSALHGFWILKIKIENSDLEQYNGVEIFNLTSLTIDKNFQVSGIAYKWKEKNKSGEFVYPREVRSKASISGSIINSELILFNLQNHNIDGLESISILEGKLTKDNFLKGSFFSDVAFQKGIFCAKKITIEELANSNLICDF